MAGRSSTDPFAAEHERVLAEYEAAKIDVVGNPSPDPFAKARFDRAMVALREHRQMLRQVGQFFGDRQMPPEGSTENPDAVAGLRVVDNEPTAPTI